MSTVIYEYPLAHAVADGMLVELFRERWNQLTSGKPLVATMNVMAEYSLAGLEEIWSEYVSWRKHMVLRSTVFMDTGLGA
jgi:hypothetical protein